MPSKGALAQRSEELRREVQERTKAFESGELNAVEFSSFMDKAEKENGDLEVAMKSYQRALGFTGLASPEESGEAARSEASDYLKSYRDGFAKMKAAATPESRRPEAVSFEFGFKKFGDEMGMKTQGVTGLSGVDASGTTNAGALSGYFLGGTAGPFVAPEFIPQIVDLRFYENVIAELIPSYACDSPVVTYVREASWTNNAAAVAEGATKPTSTHSLQRYTEQVGKIANLERVTDELIQDAGMVWSLIQQRLVQGVQRKEEVELLAGSGYPGVNGLLNRSAGFTAPQTVTAVTNLVVPASATPGIGAGTDTVSSVTPGRAVTGTGSSGTAPTGIQIAEGVLNAIIDIRVLHFFEPDAVVMNPLDFLTIRLAKDNNSQYYGGSMFGADYGYTQNQGTPSATNNFGLWGKRVVTTPAMPQGLILVGDFADYNRVLRRGGLRVDMTNTNGTDFEQNLWTARAEERIGLMVERPELFELIQLKNAP
ncbi:MAG: phage major capsid protein [Mycobacteriaceae bacterium]